MSKKDEFNLKKICQNYKNVVSKSKKKKIYFITGY